MSKSHRSICIVSLLIVILLIGLLAIVERESISRYIAAVRLERAVLDEPPLRSGGFDYELAKVYSCVAEVEERHAEEQATFRLIPLLRHGRSPVRTQSQHALMFLDRERAIQRQIPTWLKAGVISAADARLLETFLKDHELELTKEAPFVWQ